MSRSSAVACVAQWRWVLALLEPLEVRVLTAGLPACEWLLALNLFAKVEMSTASHDVVSWSSLISTQKWPLAMKFLRSMRPKPNIITCNSVISALEKGRQWPETMNLLEKASCDLAQPDVISFSACISALRWQPGLQLLRHMRLRRPAPTAVTFNATISATERAQQWHEALQLLSLVPERTVVTFGSAMNACQQALRWHMALKLAAAMEWEPKVKGNTVSCNCVLSACEKGSQWQLALLLLHQMPEALLRQDQSLNVFIFEHTFEFFYYVLN